MIVRVIACLALALGSPALPLAADTLVAARTIRAQAIIGPEDVVLVEADIPGAFDRSDAAVGMEARVALYAGRPIRPGDIGPPALVERNQIVPLVYRQAGLIIIADGRALARGGLGDALRVMNMASRTTVTGEVAADGTVVVSGSDR